MISLPEELMDWFYWDITFPYNHVAVNKMSLLLNN